MPASVKDRTEHPVSIKQDGKTKLTDLNVEMDGIRSIRLTVNGKKYVVINPDPKMVLNEWLRNELHLKGTKQLCGEGGCGTCVVAVSKKDPISHPESITAVNSCLCPILSLNGYHVISVEGLGGKKVGFHDIQKRFAERFASQCGFCTPGLVMNGYSILASAPNGITKQKLEDSFDGNICRCTGYRPILDAVKSFAKDNNILDIEDVRSCKGCKSNCSKLTSIDLSNVSHSESIWLAPECFSSLFGMMQQLKGRKLKFVAGSTGAGVFKHEDDYHAYIDIKQLKELADIEIKNDCLEVGSTVTLTQLVNFMENNAAVSKSFAVFVKHIKKIANVPVRNVATWAGNLMLNHVHTNFPSDMYLMFAAVNAQLVIADMNGCILKCSFEEFMHMSMESKVILLLIVPLSKDDEVFQTYKIMPRKQNSYAYVHAGFRATVEKDTLTFKEKPTLMFGGVGLKMVQARKVEEFLHKKAIDEKKIFEDSLRLLEDELERNPDNKLIDFNYCKNVALNLFYKFFLLLRGEKTNKRLESMIEPFDRPISSGLQSFHVNQNVAPLNKPDERIEGKLQASGEVIFVDDLPKHPNEAYAAFVLSTVANAELKDINISKAEKHPGFVAVLTHEDIPGINNFLPHGNYTEEIFATKNIEYAGQPIALVVADSQRAADEIARLVSVEYADVRKPILKLEEAIEKELFHAGNPPQNIIGNTEDALQKCDHVITGEVKSGAQHHFYIEPMTCFVVREEHDYKVFSSTQNAKAVKDAVASALCTSSASVDVQVTRVGGAFGGKSQYPPLIAAAAAIAAKSLDRPIRLTLSLNDNLKISGTRPAFLTKYKVGFSTEGRLEACEAEIFVDAGKSLQCIDGERAALWMDNAYFCPNWKISVTNCKTDKPFNTYFRGPGNLQGTFILESIMEHIASYLQKDTTEEIKEMNFYKNGQMSTRQIPVTNCLINEVWAEMRRKSEYKKRRDQIIEFNKERRWLKRGIAVTPMKFDINYHYFHFSAFVSICYGDGSVEISHGGVEMGQGINTRVRSVAAAKLGVPVDMVAVKPHLTHTAANSWGTGASVASEINCLAVYKCCETLLERITPLKERHPDAAWKELIKECAKVKVNLSAQHQFYEHQYYDFSYSVYGAACSEVEVDVLTGETHVLRSDIIYDCGESVNPRLDVGQIEGAFVQGMGYWLSEKVVNDEESGEQLTIGTWDYKPPMSKDIPIDMRVYLLHEAKNPIGYVRSKAVGEPAICMAQSCLFAVKNAIKEARKEFGQRSSYFALDGPATIDKIQTLCQVDKNQLNF